MMDIIDLTGDDDSTDEDDIIILPNKPSVTKTRNVLTRNSDSLNKSGKSVRKWSIQEVKDYVEKEIKLKQYSKNFEINCIDGAGFLELTSKEISNDLKVGILGHRKRIESFIAQLRLEEYQYSNTNNKKRKRDDHELNDVPKKKRKVSKKTQEELDMEMAKKLQPRDCKICFEKKDVDFFHSLHCGHEFCRDCLKRMFEMAITSKNFPLKCPDPDCKKEVPITDLELLLPQNLLKKFDNFSFQNIIETNPNSYSCCMTPGCKYVFFYEKGKDADFGCPICKKRYCLNCKVNWHENSTCEEYQKWCIENGTGDAKFEEFVNGQNFKACSNCGAWVEKTHGCNHMTCRCGYEFCYVCGGKYMNCECTQRVMAVHRNRNRNNQRRNYHRW